MLIFLNFVGGIFLTLFEETDAILKGVSFHLCLGLNSLCFHVIGDGHQPNSRGLYAHYKDSVIKGGMTIPNIPTFDHGTFQHFL